MTGVETIRERAAATREAGTTLRGAGVDARARWLAEASARALAATRRERTAIAEATGLSPEMVDWGVQTTLQTIEYESLRALAQAVRGTTLRSLVLILAGNVFTASVRALFVPLLLGIPVLAKASSREPAFPALLREALRDSDPTLGRAFDVVELEGGDLVREAALLADADAVAIYGSDATVDAIRARHPKTPLIAHGHGVSAAYLGAEAVGEAREGEVIDAVSIDVSAYDQRGCLSPQVIFVESREPGDAVRFAERLAAEGLEPLRERLPRGPLPVDVAAAQMQWRGLAEVEGTLVTGSGFAIAVRTDDAPGWSPGYRNVTVRPVSSLADAMLQMEPWGASLKCLGVAGASIAETNADLVRRQLSAYATPIGTMQTPALDAPADGRPIWHGLVRP